jgi:hypothetical protein
MNTMKKYIAVFIIGLMALAGCEREVISGLDGSVDNRLNDLIDGYVKDLKDAEYGWMASVYTEEGYYQFWMKFEDNNVVRMYTDNLKYENQYKTVEQSSTYTFKALQRPTLVFDTYSYLSIINDPDTSISGAGSYNEGLITDFEFEVVEHSSPDKFIFMGRFNKVNVVFRRANAAELEGVKAGRLMDKLRSTYLDMDGKFVYCESGMNRVIAKLSGQRTTYMFWYNDAGEGSGATVDGSYSVSVDGTNDITFPMPVAVGLAEDNIELSGIKSDNNGVFNGFETASGDMLEAVVMDGNSLESELPLERIFYPGDQNKIYNALNIPGDIVTNMSGTAKSAFDLMDKFMFWGQDGFGFNLVTVDQRIYFSKVKDPISGELVDCISYYISPAGIGFGTVAGEISVIASYPTVIYTYPIRWETQYTDAPTFTILTTWNNNTPNASIYEMGPAAQVLSNLKGQTFQITWSNIKLNYGMVAQMERISPGENFVIGGVMYYRPNGEE